MRADDSPPHDRPQESASIRAHMPTLVSGDHERAQQDRILRVLLGAVFAGSAFAGAVNLVNGWRPEAFTLLTLALVCPVGLGLLRAGRFYAASMTLSVALLFAIDAAMFLGGGLYDEGVIAYPLFMLCVTFLFPAGSAVLLATSAAVVSIVAMYLLEVAGAVDAPVPSTALRVVILAVVVTLSGLVLRAIRHAWEATLLHVQEAYEHTLEGWARALEFRDGVTAGHTRRVAELSMQLASRLKLSPREVVAIRRGAWLHDIGKMAIPDEILLKRGPLTPAEWEIMKRHTTLGREFVSGLSFLDAAATIPYSHHEHWDGSGYPEGLRGEDIPMAARIFAVVDTWDALTSDRPYRKAWSHAQAAAHLRGSAGTLFDPEVVERFLELIRGS